MRKHVGDQMRPGGGNEAEPADHPAFLQGQHVDRFVHIELVVFALVGARRQPAPLQLLDIDAVTDLMMFVELALVEVTIGVVDDVDLDHGSRSGRLTVRSDGPLW